MGRAIWRRVVPILEARLPGLASRLTDAPGQAEILAREWGNEFPGGILVVVGGDGSIHEAVNGLFAAGWTGLLGIVPAGTGNDAARNLGIDLSPERAAAINPLRFRAVDAGRYRFAGPDGSARGRWFLNSVSAGLSARANRMARGLGRLLGASRYPLAGAGAVISGRSAGYEVRAGNRILFEGQALNLTLANGPRFGGGLLISPRSRPDDGGLDLVVIGAMGRLRALGALARLRSGAHLDLPEVSTEGGLREPVRITSDSPLQCEADGESFTAESGLEVVVEPGRLRVLRSGGQKG